MTGRRSKRPPQEEHAAEANAAPGRTGLPTVDEDDLSAFKKRLFQISSRIVVWGLLFGVLYFLRSFFLLIFFTFVFGYLQLNATQRLEPWIRNRPARVILVGILFLAVLTTVGIFLVPKVKTQATLFVSQFSTYINLVDQQLLQLGQKHPLLIELFPDLQQPPPTTVVGPSKGLLASPTIALAQQIFGLGNEVTGLIDLNQVMNRVLGISGKVAAITSAFLLSLLFSFMIVLDLPGLSRAVAGLEYTRLRFIYVEVAASIRNFSHVLGRTLQAQFVIAVVNSILTGIGVSLLGLGSNLAFLSVIVFLFSFIPVVGVFISSVPICLIALQTKGLNTMLLAIVMITVIHLIEGYVLNPNIYGSYMRINPVVVLIILTIGGKLFHFWGLLLGVPICTYIFGHAIKLPQQKEIAEQQVQTQPAAET